MSEIGDRDRHGVTGPLLAWRGPSASVSASRRRRSHPVTRFQVSVATGPGESSARASLTEIRVSAATVQRTVSNTASRAATTSRLVKILMIEPEAFKYSGPRLAGNLKFQVHCHSVRVFRRGSGSKNDTHQVRYLRPNLKL